MTLLEINQTGEFFRTDDLFSSIENVVSNEKREINEGKIFI
jgi:hypothetical protein